MSLDHSEGSVVHINKLAYGSPSAKAIGDGAQAGSYSASGDSYSYYFSIVRFPFFQASINLDHAMGLRRLVGGYCPA